MVGIYVGAELTVIIIPSAINVFLIIDDISFFIGWVIF